GLMPCRADSLAFGMLAAICWRDERFRTRLSTSRTSLTILLAVLFAGMVVLWRWFPNPLEAVTLTIGLSWIALFYVVVLVSALLNSSGLVARFTRLLPLRELGRVSYCVYLIHFAVSYLVFGLLTRSVPYLSDLRSLGLTLLSALDTYLAAELAWNYFES